MLFRMKELRIDKAGGSVCFGQLLGMCDHVSLTLGEQILSQVLLYHILALHIISPLPLQLRRVTVCTSQCPMAQWMTRFPIWCAGLRRTAQCCRESAKRGTY